MISFVHEFKVIVGQDTAGRQAKENNNTEKSEGDIKH
jgi:hypothetical protein